MDRAVFIHNTLRDFVSHFTIWNNDVGMEDTIRRYNGQVSPQACTYSNV